jgi:hypothetical protein
MLHMLVVWKGEILVQEVSKMSSVDLYALLH